jgi:hypothetical protein
LPSLRLCWLPNGGLQPAFPSSNEMPASNYAGIPVGGAVWLGNASDPLQIVGSDVYALRAKLIAGESTSCNDLVCTPGSGPNCRMLNADYWRVGTFPAGALQVGTTNIVAVAGCLGADDPLASVDRCGPTWNAATGNLHLDVLPVPYAGPSVTAMLTLQAAQLSPGLQSLQGDAGVTAISFGTAAQANAQPIAQLTQEGDLLPIPAVSLMLPSGLAVFGQLGFGVDVQGVEAGASGHLWMSLAEAQQLVSPAQDPNTYYGGGPYVVAVVGDPAAPHAFGTGDGGYDGKGLHVLVLPVGQPSP